MTELLERAIAHARAVPPETQDYLARALLRLLGDEGPVYRLSPEEEADLAAADEEIARGALATDAQVRAMWAKHGL